MKWHDKVREWRERPGPGVYDEVPQEGIPRLFFVLTTHFTKLIKANLLFTLFCLPVITFPAAFAALHRISMKLTHDGVCDVWQEFWTEFKTDFWRRTAVGLILMTAPVLLTYFVTGFFGDAAGLGVAIMGCAVFGIYQYYLYGFLSILDVAYSANLRNALLLMMRELKCTGLIFVFCVIPVLICTAYFPYSLPVLIVLLPSITALIAAMNIHPHIRKLSEQEAQTS